MPIEIGQEAPDFELRDQHKQPVRLSDFRGKRTVVVVFLPFAFSRLCTGELCGLRDGIDDLDGVSDDDVQVLAVTCDSAFANAAWARQEAVGFPVLSDFWPHGATARAYGVFDERVGAATRGSFIIDRQGVVRWKVEHGIPDARDVDAYRRALAEIA